VFNWLDNLIVPSGFLLVVSHLFAILVLVFMGWVGKKGGIKTWMSKIFLQNPISSTTRDVFKLFYYKELG
jgi:hypothetical protein